MNIKDFYHSRSFRVAVGALIVLIVILFAFAAGVTVGERRATFAGRFGGEYSRIFEDRGNHMMIFNHSAPLGYGAAGKVISISSGSLTIAMPDNTERIVRVTSDTLIREFNRVASSTDIEPNDSVIVIGSPDVQGEVVARFIRIIGATTTPHTP